MNYEPVFTIVIPTWDGRDLLQKNLPQVIEATGEETEILVIDNGSTDGTADWLKKQPFARVRLIKLPRNLGFGPACNIGVHQSRAKLVVLLNNDVVPQKGFLDAVEEIFAERKVFAVSLHEPQFGPAAGEFREGFFHHFSADKSTEKKYSLWASGGSAVFRKEYWQALQGFDPLYHPFYWEDVDIGYRAWKQGWEVWWQPKAVVHHRHEGTVSRFPLRYVRLIQQRNQLLFIWKNITDPVLFQRHLGALFVRLVKHPGYFQVVLAAAVKLPAVIRGRTKARAASWLTDRQVLAKFHE